MKVRQKPVVLEAFDWKNAPAEFAPDWFVNAWEFGMLALQTDGTLHKRPLKDGVYGQSEFLANPGDIIMLSPEGELIACESGIFWSLYERVNEDSKSETNFNGGLV